MTFIVQLKTTFFSTPPPQKTELVIKSYPLFVVFWRKKIDEKRHDYLFLGSVKNHKTVVIINSKL